MKKRLIVLMFVSILILSFVSCNKTEFVDSKYIIEADAFKEEYQNNNIVIIDAREVSKYKKAHVENAISIRAFDLVSNDPVQYAIPSKDEFEKFMGSKGIDQDAQVYIYDDDMMSSFRILYVMKLYGHENVKIVNGGFDKLSKLKLKGEKGIFKLPETTYKAKDLDESMIIFYDDVLNIIKDENTEAKIIDVRSLPEYSEGYIKGAILYPHTDNLYSDNTLMSPRDIGLFYKKVGVDKDDEVILYCKSSFRATQTYFALIEAGYENVKVYDGAMIEWIKNKAPLEGNTGSNVISPQDGS